MNTNPRHAAIVAVVALALAGPTSAAAVAPDVPTDTEAPRVLQVFGVVEQLLLPLAEYASVNAPVEALVLEFSEPMWNPPGDSTPHDVTNPESYMVLAAGLHRGVATSTCDEPWIDETIVPILSVGYDATELKVQLNLDLDQIPDVLHGQYRIIVCDGGPTDPAGNAVVSVEPQVVQSQMWRTFRVDGESRLANSHFDCDVEGWVPLTGTPEEWEFDAADVNWAESSGSGVLDNLTGAPSVAVGQCVVMSGADRMRFGAQVMLAQAVEETVEITLTCTFYSAADCAGAALGDAGEAFVVAVNEDGWNEIGTEINAVGGTASAGCALVATPIGAPTPVTIDEATLTPQPMFEDDFEMANFSRWSSWYPSGDD